MLREVEVIADNGRDAGRVFVVREMPAAKLEMFAFRALMAACRTNADIDPTGGFGELVQVGFKALFSADFQDLRPLLDEMMTGVDIVLNKGRADQIRRGIIDSDTEELETRLKIRQAWIELHTGFTFPAFR